MQILCVGCTGFIGGALRARLLASGHSLIVVARQASANPAAGESWIPFEADWMEHLRHVDALLNFAGAPLAQWPWTKGRRALIRESRAGLCRRIVDRLARYENRPRIWVNASAVGFYGDRSDERLTESSSAGQGFLASVCQEWEAEVMRAAKLGIREVRLRLGPVLGPGGMLKSLQRVYAMHLGGTLGDGKQLFPWVHREDVARATQFALETPCSGAFNVVSPAIVTQQEFSQALAQVLHVSARVKVPAFMLRALLGGMSEMLLFSQRALPQQLEQNGFTFNHVDLKKCLEECVEKA